MIETEYVKNIWKEIEKFIAPFRKPEVIDIFTNGYCYYFAKILKIRFNTFFWHPTELYYNPVDCHFACLVANKLWDINGVIFDDVIEYGTKKYGNWYNWFYYIDFEPKDSERVANNCIYKN